MVDDVKSGKQVFEYTLPEPIRQRLALLMAEANAANSRIEDILNTIVLTQFEDTEPGLDRMSLSQDGTKLIVTRPIVK